MSAPFTPGGLLGAGGSGPNVLGINAEFDATECDKIMVMATGSGLATTETISIYTRHPDGTNAIGGGPPGTVPIYTAAGAAAQLTASIQTMVLEGGFIYVFVKTTTAGSCGIGVAIKRAQGS